MVKKTVAKLQKIKEELNSQFFERENVITSLLVALMCKQHLLLVGPPGTAKSQVVRDLCSRIIEGKYFEWLLNATSDPSEILGGISLKEMQNDKFVRNTKGKLPEAHIAFIDELYRGNEPILNIMLSLLNERIFHNDGVAIKAPLITMVAATNDMNDDCSLAAITDRIMFKCKVDYISDEQNRLGMWVNYLNNSNKEKTFISIEEIDQLSEHASTLKFDNIVFNTFNKILAQLQQKSIFVSDRRTNICLSAMQAHALLNGKDRVTNTDLKILENILWQKEKDIPEINSLIIKLIDPFEDEINQLLNELNQDFDIIATIQSKKDKNRASIEMQAKSQPILGKMNKIIEDAKKHNNKNVQSFVLKRQEIEEKINALYKEATGLEV